LDKGTLRLGDSTLVNFEKTIVFLTSNLGARDMSRELNPTVGFQANLPRDMEECAGKLERIADRALRKNFSPEFLNRIDAVVTYHPLDSYALRAILDQQIADFQEHVDRRLGERAFQIEVPAQSRKFLLERGTSPEYGARELKRTLHRQLIQPLASLLTNREIDPGSTVRAELAPGKESLVLKCAHNREYAPVC
jgi:ATP-dependent Clp protease ATP-binding subunit ClpA